MLEPKQYLPRLIDEKITELMKIYGALCVEGPKWCGKTWTSMSHAKSGVFISNPENNFQYKNKKLAEMNPSYVLEGEHPRLIDEWQEVPALWDAVRCEVDNREDMGQFNLAIYIREIRCFYVLRTHEAAHANAYALELLPRDCATKFECFVRLPPQILR